MNLYHMLPSIPWPAALFVLVVALAVIARIQMRRTAIALAERKRTEQLLEESELRFRILTRATNEAVWDWNMETDSVWWNRNVQTLFGYDEEAVGIASVWRNQNVHPDDRERIVTSLQARVQRNEDFWSGEYRFRRADGSYADIFDRGYILRDHNGRATRMIGSMMDVTKRKREMELARARDAALESARLKSQFLANMSHEIRTPMNSIIGMTDILLHTDLASEQREFVEIVRMSGESLLTIINDILDFSKIEAGKLKFEMLDFEPRTAVEEVITMLLEQTHAKKLQLSWHVDSNVPSGVCGDPGRLRQVLTNIISNAIKFTPQGEIKVRATKETESDTHVVLRFEVADTGIGVPEEARACLFQPFSQVDASTTRKYGGTGLGLAICKQLVNLMGGQIGCDSVPEKGSSFWFTARFEKPSRTAALEGISLTTDPKAVNARQRLPTAVRHRKRVLIAEDNPFNQKVVLRQVREMGFGADAVANGIEVVEALNRISYDLVLMDCQMPEMDGYECSAEIRRREDHMKHVPIIAMTAHVMKEDRDKCLAAGMDDFLSKPVRVAHLESVLIRWLTGSAETMAMAIEAAATALSDSAANRPNKDAPGSEPPATESSGPPVDLEILTELAGDNEERLQELADRYVRQTSEQLLTLRDTIATGAAPDVKRIAHSAAGSSAMCGMKPMVALLRELERMGQTNQLAAAPHAHSEAEKEFARIKQFLDARLESAGMPELVNS
jgi:PAS domain S-box-containing protein